MSKQSKKAAKRLRRKAVAVLRRAQSSARHELTVAQNVAAEIREQARAATEIECAELRAQAHRETAQIRTDARSDAHEESARIVEQARARTRSLAPAVSYLRAVAVDP